MNNNAPYINIHTHKKVENELTIEIFGVHPLELSVAQIPLSAEIEERVQAIGEIGLDARNSESLALQEEFFRAQLKIAEQLALPVVIHCVRTYETIMQILKEYTLRAVIFHGFIGSEQMARQATKRGYYLSFGHRCFASPKSMEALKKIEGDHLFLETDQSDISIEQIYRQAAKLRGETLEELKQQINNNYINIFKKQ